MENKIIILLHKQETNGEQKCMIDSNKPCSDLPGTVTKVPALTPCSSTSNSSSSMRLAANKPGQ